MQIPTSHPRSTTPRTEPAPQDIEAQIASPAAESGTHSLGVIEGLPASRLENLPKETAQQLFTYLDEQSLTALASMNQWFKSASSESAEVIDITSQIHTSTDRAGFSAALSRLGAVAPALRGPAMRAAINHLSHLPADGRAAAWSLCLDMLDDEGRHTHKTLIALANETVDLPAEARSLSMARLLTAASASPQLLTESVHQALSRALVQLPDAGLSAEFSALCESIVRLPAGTQNRYAHMLRPPSPHLSGSPADRVATFDRLLKIAQQNPSRIGRLLMPGLMRAVPDLGESQSAALARLERS